jgi:hypothetical protein
LGNTVFYRGTSKFVFREEFIYTPTKVKHHPIFLSIYFFTSILLKQ